MWLQFWRAVSQISIWLLAKKTAFTIHYSLICLEGRNVGEKVTVLTGGCRVMWVSWHYCQGISIHWHWICTFPSSLSIQFFYSLQWCNETSVVIFCILAPKQKITNMFQHQHVYEAFIYDSMKHFLCWMYTKRKSQGLVSSKWSVHCCQFGTLFIQRYRPISFFLHLILWSELPLPVLLKCLQMWFVGNALS